MAGGMRPGTAAAAEVAVRYQPSGRASHPSAGWRVAVRWPFRKVPLATSVVLLLLLVSVALRTHPQGAEDVVAWSSTNVHNLAHHPIAALLVSAFVIPGGLLSQLPLVAAGLGMVERAIGSLRTLVVAAAGHVLPTLLTEYGAAASGHLHLVAMSSPYRSDVGISLRDVRGARRGCLPAHRPYPNPQRPRFERLGSRPILARPRHDHHRAPALAGYRCRGHVLVPSPRSLDPRRTT